MKNNRNKFSKKLEIDLNNKIILINKPIGFTSNDIVQIIKKTYSLKKVGHSGTLDPLATGLLIIGTGNKTKELNSIIAKDKEYITTIKFNEQTSTYDAEGEIINYSTLKVNYWNIELEIKKMNNVFLYQKPPIFSAIKVKGKKLYEYAWQNEVVQIPLRKVFINNIQIKHFDYEKQLLTISINVSKGFYIRSFGNDLGIALNNFAFIKELNRTKIGDYNIKNSYDFFDLVKVQEDTK